MSNRLGAGATKAFKKWLKRTKKAYAKKKFRASFYLFAKRQNAKVRTIQYWRRRKSFYLTLLYFTVAALVSSVAQLWFANVKPETAFGFYTAAGAMAGGTLAIIFTFNTLLVNFALTQYPPEFFRLSGYDKKQDRLYFVIALLTVGLFVMGFMYRDLSSPTWNYWLVWAGLLSIFAVLYLVFRSYVLIRARLNPIASFGYITRPAFSLLAQCDKDAKRLADMLHKDPTLKPDKAYIADYQPHMLLQSRYDELNEFIGYLYDYHDKLVDKKDYSAAFKVLDAIGSLIVRYVDVRKNSFVLLPSDYLMVPATDAQKFFDTNFQRMADRTKVYMRLGNQDGTRKVLSLFEGIGIKLRELNFPKLQYENPPFEQCIGYLGIVCDEAIKQKDLEATYQLARIYAVLGAVAISKEYMHAPSTIYDKLLKLALYAGAEKQSVVNDQIAKAFTACVAAYKQLPRGAARTGFKIYLDKLGEFYWYYFAFTSTTTDYQANTSYDMVQPLSTIRQWMAELARAGSNTRNSDRDSAQRDLVELADQLWRLLRSLTDRKNISLVDRYLAVQFTETIKAACSILINSAYKNGWQRNSEAVLRQASWLLNQISFFADNAPDKLEHDQLDELSKKATIISLYALHKGNTKLAMDGINVSHHLAITSLTKAAKSADYDAPRIMVNGGVIAILALQKGNTEVLKHFREVAAKFNAAYGAKFFPNGIGFQLNGRNYMGAHPDQLNEELRTVSRQLTERSRDRLMGTMLDLPEDYLMRLAPATAPLHFRALIKYLKRDSTTGDGSS